MMVAFLVSPDITAFIGARAAGDFLRHALRSPLVRTDSTAFVMPACRMR